MVNLARKSESTVGSIVQQINEEHKVLRQTLSDIEHKLDTLFIEKPEDITKLVALFQTLHDHLEKHFALEESEPSFAEVGSENTYLVSGLKDLFKDHALFLRLSADLTNLCLHQIEIGVFSLKIIKKQYAALKGLLREHDAKETKLFIDANYIEIGGEG